jgi:cAMP-dependent protein kinase regulator
VAFQNGERIVTKGDDGSVFYLIEDGEVKVHDIGIGDGKAVDQFLSAGGKNSLICMKGESIHSSYSII